MQNRINVMGHDDGGINILYNVYVHIFTCIVGTYSCVKIIYKYINLYKKKHCTNFRYKIIE